MSIRVGLIGAGAIAADHCRNVNRYAGARLVAVADLNQARREEVQDAFGVERGYDSWEKLVADPGIDAVAVALPNVLHAPVSLAAIHAGKHVLLDKPFAMNAREAKQVGDAARRKGVVMMVGMNQRYSREAQTLRALVGRGDLGEIYHVKAYWMRRMGSPKFGTWFVSKAQSGGGCLLDIGVHILDLGMYVAGVWHPVAVSGQVYGKFGHRGIGGTDWGRSVPRKNIKFDVDDFATALIKCGDGVTIELNVSWVLHQDAPDRHNVELFGTEAGGRVWPAKLFRMGKVRGEYEVVEPQDVRVEDLRECRQFDWLDAIRGKRPAICTLEQALIVQKVLDAIYQSSATGKEVRIR